MPDLDNYSFVAQVSASQDMKIGEWDDQDISWNSVTVHDTEGIFVTDRRTGQGFYVDCGSCDNDESIILTVKEAIETYEKNLNGDETNA